MTFKNLYILAKQIKVNISYHYLVNYLYASLLPTLLARNHQTTCYSETINASVLKTALSVWIKHAIWRSRKPKVTSDLTTIWTKIPYNGVPIPHPCLLSPKRDISSFWRLLLSWHCHRLAQPERMPIRNTDVHNL